MRAKRAAALLLAAWSGAAPLLARAEGGEEAWVRGNRDFDGQSGRPGGESVAGNLTANPALVELAAMGGAPETKIEAGATQIPAPEKKSSYWQYNDYSHSTGESIGMLALDVVAWLFAPIVLVAGIIGVLFSFILGAKH